MASFRIGVAPTAGGFQMPSSLIRHPATLKHDPQAQQKREFDRWRTAIEIVQLMREAGIACELWGRFRKPPLTSPPCILAPCAASAFRKKADIRRCEWHVRFGPILLQKSVAGFFGQ